MQGPRPAWPAGAATQRPAALKKGALLGGQEAPFRTRALDSQLIGAHMVQKIPGKGIVGALIECLEIHHIAEREARQPARRLEFGPVMEMGHMAKAQIGHRHDMIGQVQDAPQIVGAAGISLRVAGHAVDVRVSRAVITVPAYFDAPQLEAWMREDGVDAAILVAL